MCQPVGAKCALRDTSTVSRMEVLSLKGPYPSDIFRRIKGFFAQRLEPCSRYNDVVNLFEDASQLPPVLIRHPRKAGIPGDPGVDDHRRIHELRPETDALVSRGTSDSVDARMPEMESMRRPRCAR